MAIKLADKLLGIANPREQHSDAAAYEICAEAYEINAEHCAEAYEINEEQIRPKPRVKTTRKTTTTK